MRSSGIEWYNKKLTDLGLTNDSITHAVVYYDGNESISRCVAKSLPGHILDFYSTKPERYDKFRYNEHHWTTRFCFNKVIPEILSSLIGIKIDKSKYETIKFMSGTNDISYSVPVSKSIFAVKDMISGEERHGDNSILRDIGKTKDCTDYHKLFFASHSVSLITNETTDEKTKLIVNCDSMSIPIIPILADFFNQILVLDNRTDTSFNTAIEEFKPTHYLGLMLSQSYYDNKHFDNLK